MKYRCCSCKHVFVGGSVCPKCQSNSLETLTPVQSPVPARTENHDRSGPRDLLEVPGGRDDLCG